VTNTVKDRIPAPSTDVAEFFNYFVGPSIGVEANNAAFLKVERALVRAGL
jgi:hypothetical protein